MLAYDIERLYADRSLMNIQSWLWRFLFLGGLHIIAKSAH
jgi:hypothetical protein